MSYKRVPMYPLTGFLDTRILPEQMPKDYWRFRQNYASPDIGRLCRMPGFEKFLSTTVSYGNMDLHDQLLPIQFYYDNLDPKPTGADDVTSWPNALCDDTLKTRSQGREPITFGAQFNSDSGIRRVILGTQSRLYLGNLTTRNWRLLGDGFGGTTDDTLRVRWKMAVLKNYGIFTNGFDQPVSWLYNDGPSGCAQQSVKAIASLNAIALSTASIAVTFGGCVHLMNVVMDGQRFGTRIVNSDFNSPLEFAPDDDSIAAFTELPNSEGETILAAAPLGDELIVYTDKAIYVGEATGNADNPFEYRKHYSPEGTQNRCLVYPNTLVNTGDFHFFAGNDGFYTFTQFQRVPKIVDWIYQASGIPFEGIDGYGRLDKDLCSVHIAAFDATTRSIKFSWAEEGEALPSKSINLYLDTEFASTEDKGWTCLFNFQPDYRLLFRDWLMQTCVCDFTELSTLGLQFIKEGLPIALCQSGPGPQSVWTSETTSFYGYTTENWNKATADSNSLCQALGGRYLADFCNECAAPVLFCGALSDDYCLKQIGTAYSREICTNPTATGLLIGTDYRTATGLYSTVGYNSVMRSGPQAFDSRLFKKNLNRLILNGEAQAQTIPCVISTRIGYSFSPRDPNKPNCGIQWTTPVRQYFECPDQSLDEGEVPNSGFEFPFFATGIFLYLEITIASLTDQEDLDSALTPGIGGAGCFSGIDVQVRADSPTIKT